jgi:hypothetical protein
VFPFTIDADKMEDCHKICLELLERPQLPQELRALLNFYIAIHQEYDLTKAYLQKRLYVVEGAEQRIPSHASVLRRMFEQQMEVIGDSIPLDYSSVHSSRY